MKCYNKTFLELPSFETTNLTNIEIKDNLNVQPIYVKELNVLLTAIGNL